MVEIKKTIMSEEIIRRVIEIDRSFYHDEHYCGIEWYFDRYNEQNEITVLLVDNMIVGYFIFYGISEKLFNRIYNLEYDEDYKFSKEDIDLDSNIKYFASVVVEESYRKFSLPLIMELKKQFVSLDSVIAIVISKEGEKMCCRYMNFIGAVNNKSKIYAIKK